MIIIGLVLGLAGGWSIRTVLMLVGFGAGWLLANVFDANLLVTLVIAVVGALFAWLIVRLAASIVFFVVGALVGLLVGARLFRLLEGGDGNLLLAIVFIPAIGIAGGWLAEKTKERFVAWGTSIGGAALVLGRAGRAGQRPGVAARPERDVAGPGRGGGVGRPVGRLPAHPAGRREQRQELSPRGPLGLGRAVLPASRSQEHSARSGRCRRVRAVSDPELGEVLLTSRCARGA